MNNESPTSMKHCGQKIVSNSLLYQYKNITLLWRGHLYNRSSEQKACVIDPLCIIRYYLKNGMYKTLRKINGDFAFVLLDPRITEDESVLYVAMDIFGKYPLFTHTMGEGEIHIMEKEQSGTMNHRFLPSCYSKYALSHKVHSIWTLQKANTPYYLPPIPMPLFEPMPTPEFHQLRIKNILLNNVQRRIEAHGITNENATLVLLLDEQPISLFQSVLDSVKTCGFTPLLCSKEEPLLHEENEYSKIFVFSASQRFYKHSFHEKHVVLYPCVDVFFVEGNIRPPQYPYRSFRENHIPSLIF